MPETREPLTPSQLIARATSYADEYLRGLADPDHFPLILLTLDGTGTDTYTSLFPDAMASATGVENSMAVVASAIALTKTDQAVVLYPAWVTDEDGQQREVIVLTHSQAKNDPLSDEQLVRTRLLFGPLHRQGAHARIAAWETPPGQTSGGYAEALRQGHALIGHIDEKLRVSLLESMPLPAGAAILADTLHHQARQQRS